jgi:phospholipase D1/2
VVVEGFMSDSNHGNMRLQLCRSSCEWSTGIKKPEHSIYNAYLHRISKAKKFIYIENQFFMSNENEISEVIAERIKEAFKKGEKFKIIVMLPLLPGF